MLRLVHLDNRDDRVAGDLFPVEEERVAGHGDQVAGLRAVVHSDDTILLDERASAETLLFDAQVDRQGEVFPVDEIVAHRVAPVLARVFRRIGLIEQVVAFLPDNRARSDRSGSPPEERTGGQVDTDRWSAVRAIPRSAASAHPSSAVSVALPAWSRRSGGGLLKGT